MSSTPCDNNLVSAKVSDGSAKSSSASPSAQAESRFANTGGQQPAVSASNDDSLDGEQEDTAAFADWASKATFVYFFGPQAPTNSAAEAELFRKFQELRQDRIERGILNLFDLPSSQAFRDEHSTSLCNYVEANVSVKMVLDLVLETIFVPQEIAVIAMYSAQVRLIRQKLNEQAPARIQEAIAKGTCPADAVPDLSKVAVYTADAATGKEFMCVIVNLVGTGDDFVETSYAHVPGKFYRADTLTNHMTDPGRLCVALSRSKGPLTVLGNCKALRMALERRVKNKKMRSDHQLLGTLEWFKREGLMRTIDDTKFQEADSEWMKKLRDCQNATNASRSGYTNTRRQQ